MKKLRLERISIVATILSGFLLSLLNIFRYAGETTLGADIVSRVLPAIGHRIGIGVPYLNYWEITPPGHYIVLDIWANFFGFSTLSIKFLHVVVSFGIVFLVYYLLSRVLKGLYLSIISITIYFFLFSSRLTTFILPAEILGLFFSLAGVSSLFYFRQYKRALFISSFLLFFAGQIKDPYLLSVLALVPYILFISLKSKKEFFISIVFSFFGILLSIGVNILYLFLLGSMRPYIDILISKSVAYDIFDIGWLLNNYFIHIRLLKEVFLLLQYHILVPAILYFAIKLFSKFKDKSLVIGVTTKSKIKIVTGRLNWQIKNSNIWIFIFYIFGLSVGFVIQHSLGSHYYIIGVFPLIAYLGICFYGVDNEISKYNKQPRTKVHGFSKKSLFTALLHPQAKSQRFTQSLNKYKILRILVFLVFLVFLFPKKAYFVDYNFQKILDLRFIPRLVLWADNNSISPIVKRITERTVKGDCIIDVYGWGVGTTYLYTERMPCSRFFITNFVARPWQINEYRQSVLTNNPKAIIYSPTAGDLDNKEFEKTVVNFPKVLNNCYKVDQDFKTLYFPKFDDAKLNGCLENSLM